MVTKGTATLVTGGTLIPPTIDSDPYPNEDPNAIIRSEVGVKGGLARRIGPGDVVVNLPGTPHWLSQIDGSIEYFEIQIPNVDPAPGIERAEVKPKLRTCMYAAGLQARSRRLVKGRGQMSVSRNRVRSWRRPLAALGLASRVASCAWGASLLAQPQAPAPDPQDVEEGMTIFRTKADCQTCHGWAADGRKMDTQMPDAPNLRTSRLGRAGIIYAIKCGRPGRDMPAFDRMAYKDAARCNNTTEADLKKNNLALNRSGRDASAARDRDGGRFPVREGDREGTDGPREVRRVLGRPGAGRLQASSNRRLAVGDGRQAHHAYHA